MKKFIKGLLFSFSALLLVVALASCEMPTTPPATDECAHTATSWKNDGANHWHLCTKCSEKYDEEAHKYGEWGVVENATTSSEGIKSRTCSVCSYVEYGVIDKLQGSSSDVATKDTAVYVKAPAEWAEVYCYFFGSDSKPLSNTIAWPGQKMTCVDSANNIWGYIVPANTGHVIFNNGVEQTEQTIDIPFNATKNLYALTDIVDGKYDCTFDIHTPASDEPTLNSYAGGGEIVTPPAEGMVTIYAKLQESWQGHYAYWWGVDGAPSWPGVQMTLVDAANSVYSINIPNTVKVIIFAEGDGMDQTLNLTIAEGSNAFIVNPIDGYDPATPAIYENGEFKELEAGLPEFYVIGSITGWGFNADYLMVIDSETKTATLTVEFAVGDEFKVATEGYGSEFRVTDMTGAESFTASADGYGNAVCQVAGTYIITVSNLDKTPTCSISLSE